MKIADTTGNPGTDTRRGVLALEVLDAVSGERMRSRRNLAKPAARGSGGSEPCSLVARAPSGTALRVTSPARGFRAPAWPHRRSRAFDAKRLREALELERELGVRPELIVVDGLDVEARSRQELEHWAAVAR
jgi:hypothetical protein